MSRRGRKGRGGPSDEDLRPGHKARAAKAEAAAKKQAKERALREAEEAAQWEDGSNQRRAKRDSERANRQAEREALRLMKEQQLREEEAEALGGRSGGERGRGSSKVAARREARVRSEGKVFERLQAPELQARGIDAALAVMTIATENTGDKGDGAADLAAAEKLLRKEQTGVNVDDANPEKRMKAAWNRFKARELPILRAEKPQLRLSQHMEILRKQWDKSDENPVYAAKKAKEMGVAEESKIRKW